VAPEEEMMKQLYPLREETLRKVLVAIALTIAVLVTLYATATHEQASNQVNLHWGGAGYGWAAAPNGELSAH
jgi:hypothetical protein